MSSKDTEKKFVGQPIFKQLTDLLPKGKFDLLAIEHKTDRYYKAFPNWTQLGTLLFFQEFYFLLLKYFEFILSVSRLDKISFDKLFIFDSSTI